MLAALVMVGGLAFAVGRWSVEDSGSTAMDLRDAAAVAQQATQADGFGGQATQADGFGGQATQADGFGGQIAAAAGSTQAADDAVQVQDSGQGGQAGDGPPGGVRGLPGGFGLGGVEGVVSGIGDLGITVQSADGESLRFIIDATTDVVTETDTDVTSVAPGEIVQVQFPFPEFVDGQVVEPAEGSDVATLVTVLPPGTELAVTPFGQPGVGGQRSDQGGSQDQGGFGVPGGQRGFGRVGLQGSVVAVEDDVLTLLLADGGTQTVLTGPGTSFVRQLDADASQLTVGDEVRVQVAREGFASSGTATPAEEPRTATQVTILSALPE